MKMLLTLAVLGVVAAAGVGGWWAYEEGLWGDNPRAPTIANFRPVVEAWAQRKDELRPKCISLSLDSGSGVQRGHPGIMFHDMPGLGAVTLTLKTAEPYQQNARDRTILKLDALARAGFYKAADAQLQGGGPEMLPAREYVLTVKGWENSEGSCFFLGRPEVLEVVSFARVQPDPEGVRTYAVAYKVGIRELPAWVREDDGKDLFGDTTKTSETKELRLLRGDHGWLPEPLVKRKDLMDKARLAVTIDVLLPPLVDAARIMQLASEGDLANPKACLLLPHRVGIEADEIESGLTGPMSATYYEDDGLPGEPNRIRRVWLSRLTNLAAVGVFRTEAVPRDDIRNRPPATKFILEEKYLPHIDKKYSGCLKLGPVKMKLLANSIQVQPRRDGELNYRFKAIGNIAQDAWSRAVNLSSLPEARTYLEHGVPITGYVEFKDGEWKLLSGGSVIPVVVQFPERTSALAPGAAGGSQDRRPLSAGPTSSVHVLSVYKGKTSGEARFGETRQGRIHVRVGLRDQPITLVLSAYDPVVWSIAAESGVNITRVVALGYHKGSVEGISPDKVFFPGGNYLPSGEGSRRRSGHSIGAIPEMVERIVGRRPASVQTAYETDHFLLGSAPSGFSGKCNIRKSVEGGRASYSGECLGGSTPSTSDAPAPRRIPGAPPSVVPVPSTVIVPLPGGNVEIRSGGEPYR